MSKINVSTITNRTGTSGPVLSGVTTATNGFHVTSGSVGIGTDNPNAALSVLSTAYPTVTITRDHPTNYPRLRIANTSIDGADLDGLGSGGGFRIACVAAGVSTERVRLTSTGCAIISSTGSFSPYVADANLQITDDTNPKLVISNPGNSTYSLAVGTDNSLKFRNESTAVDSMLINYTTNNLEIVDGNLKVASGHGIDFSATADGAGSSQNELFDDYEFGNWIPVIKSGSNVITVTDTTQSYFRYIKIGRLVKLFFSLNNATTSGSTGGVCTIGGLPFAIVSETNNRFISGDAIYYNSGFMLSGWPIYPHMAAGDTTMNLYEKGSSSAPYGSVTVSNVGSNGYFFFTIEYYTS